MLQPAERSGLVTFLNLNLWKNFHSSNQEIKEKKHIDAYTYIYQSINFDCQIKSKIAEWSKYEEKYNRLLPQYGLWLSFSKDIHAALAPTQHALGCLREENSDIWDW